MLYYYLMPAFIFPINWSSAQDLPPSQIENFLEVRVFK